MPSAIPQEKREFEDGTLPVPRMAANKAFEDKDGNPIWVFLHSSIKDTWRRNNLTLDIESNGGVVRPDDNGVDTVIVDPNNLSSRSKHDLQTAYNAHGDRSMRSIWVEPMTFVKRSIDRGEVIHILPKPKGMGGAVGSDKTPFTEEDDANLAKYLAIRIPDPASGGRRGNNVYAELYGAYHAMPEEYAWVGRHPEQSWRNRYNKNVERFDALIEIYVEQEQPGRKQAYGLQRNAKKRDWLEQLEHHDENNGELAKKPRVDSSSVNIRGASVHLSSNKGKERAFSEDPNNARHESSPPPVLPATEPGPSRKVSRTYTDRPRQQGHNQHDVELRSSQATLVEPSQPPQTLINNRSKAPPSHTHNIKTDVDQEPALSPRSLTQRSEPQKNPSLPASLKPSIGVIKRQSQKEPAEDTMISSNPPSRNNRLDSRLDPSILPSRPKPRLKKGKKLEHVEIISPALEELADVVDHTHPVNFSSVPLGETFEEEQDVEDLLVNGNITQEEISADMGPNVTRDGNLDSDDAQTDRILRQPNPLITLPQQRRPLEMLRRFHEASATTHRSSLAPSIRSAPTRNPFAKKPRHSAPEHRRDVFGLPSLALRTSKTPDTPEQGPGSPYSIESFPIIGTKASAAKKHMEIEEKHTPYKPPSVSRAALVPQRQRM
ncbi:hypothetical protein H0H93_012257 [Arthromyces matolae]|nr:hypothetical protein H0H93_012257 [Arthromyces matolae]